MLTGHRSKREPHDWPRPRCTSDIVIIGFIPFIHNNQVHLADEAERALPGPLNQTAA